MADDLDDEWWLNKEDAGAGGASTDKIEFRSKNKSLIVNAGKKDKKSKKRKVESNNVNKEESDVKVKKRKAETNNVNKEERDVKVQKRKAEAKDVTTEVKDIKGKKRKKSDPQDDADEVQQGDSKKKSSKKEKKHQRKRITDEEDEVLSKPGTSDDVKAMITKVLKDRLGAEAIYDLLPDSENDYYPHNCDLLEPDKYLSAVLTTWRSAVKKSKFMNNTGCPILLIVSSSAIRAVELNRQIKGFLDDKCKVAKLFAKHIKIEEQKKFLSKTNCQVGIGTPGRILSLIKEGSLHLESLIAVVLDWNWRDSKLKRMSDIPEVRQDLVGLLKDYILETVRGSSCKLALL